MQVSLSIEGKELFPDQLLLLKPPSPTLQKKPLPRQQVNNEPKLRSNWAELKCEKRGLWHFPGVVP